MITPATFCQRVYVRPDENRQFDCVYIRLPVEVQRPIDGGCNCKVCQARPQSIPAYDTLCIPLGGKHSGTVHWPDLEQSAELL